MSDFSGEGFAPFPSIYTDNKYIGSCSEWSDERIADKVSEYWMFLQRENIMPRARQAAERIISHLSFEMDWRTDYFAIQEMEANCGVRHLAVLCLSSRTPTRLST